MAGILTIRLLSMDTGSLIGEVRVPKEEYMGITSPDVFSVRVTRKTAAVILRNANN